MSRKKTSLKVELELLGPGFLKRVALHSLIDENLPTDPPGLAKLLACHSDGMLTELSIRRPIVIRSIGDRLFLVSGYRYFSEAIAKDKAVYGIVLVMSSAQANKYATEELLMDPLFEKASSQRDVITVNRGSLDFATKTLVNAARGCDQFLEHIMSKSDLDALRSPETIALVLGRSPSTIYSLIKQFATREAKPSSRRRTRKSKKTPPSLFRPI